MIGSRTIPTAARIVGMNFTVLATVATRTQFNLVTNGVAFIFRIITLIAHFHQPEKMFDIGQKVVCVDGTFPHSVLNYMRQLPIAGKVYTVRDVKPAQGWQERDGVPGPETCAILLDECRNAPPPHRKQWGECGFDPRRFRELETGFDYNFAEESQTETLTL